MKNEAKWLQQQYRMGMSLLLAGLFIGVLGLALPLLASDLPFNTRIITGVGILLAGIGAGNLLKYNAVRKDARATRQLAIEENDERTLLLRGKAGNRAYWVSTALAFGGLMWLSFAANGSLPAPSPDAQWFFLTGVVILPFVVYTASLVYDQQNS